MYIRLVGETTKAEFRRIKFVYCTKVVHKIRAIMLVISSREFRQNQKEYFDRADKGEQIIVQRGKDKAYLLTPVGEDDMYFTAEMIDRIKQSIEEIKSGDTLSISSANEIDDLLGL